VNTAPDLVMSTSLLLYLEGIFSDKIVVKNSSYKKQYVRYALINIFSIIFAVKGNKIVFKYNEITQHITHNAILISVDFLYLIRQSILKHMI